MNDAFEKNRAALTRLLGSSALAEHLNTHRIGIWSTASSNAVSGRILAETLGDVLGRLWQHIDVHGELATVFLQAARCAASSAAYVSDIEERWNPPYDFVISIGTDAPPNTGRFIQIGAVGWDVLAGSKARVGDDPNPVGPIAAAALASAEAFKVLFQDALKDQAGPTLDDFAWSVWDYGTGSEQPAIRPLHLNESHVFGTGAVTHGLLWVLERWPHDVSGALHLVDQDKFDRSNAQRYVGLRTNHVDRPKVDAVAERLHDRLTNLRVHPHPLDMNRYYKTHRPNYDVRLAIAGLDSPEGRRQLALKLPSRVVNMWTEGHWLGAARFGTGDGWPCLYCSYSENLSAPLDETGEISQQTGLKPARIRELLNSGCGLDEHEAREIAQRFGLPDQNVFIDKPIRSVRGHLCATGKVALRDGDPDSDVPLAFSSLLAGVFGFVELVKELWGHTDKPGRWAYNTLHPPRPGFQEETAPKPRCYLCSDPAVRSIMCSATDDSSSGGAAQDCVQAKEAPLPTVASGVANPA